MTVRAALTCATLTALTACLPIAHPAAQSGGGPAAAARSGPMPTEPERISVDALVQALADGDAVVLDTRDELQWLAARIPGALHLPIGAVEARAAELPEDKLLVAYCSCPAEETSLVVADQLLALGFPRVAVLAGGFELWEEMGEPIDRR